MMGYLIQLCLLLIPIVFALTPSLYNAPPTIISPKHLDDPKELVKLGKQTSAYVSLICNASNADDIEWKYSRTIDGTPGMVPLSIEQRNTKQDEETLVLSRTLTDQFMYSADRSSLNGYYKCIVSNRWGFKVETPPIRLIIQEIRYRSRIVEPKAGTGYSRMPYKMKCIDDGVIMSPSDILDFNEVQFLWFLSNTSTMEPFRKSSTVTVNQKNGDLYFSYLEPSDSHGVGANDIEYHCNARTPNMINQLVVGRHKLLVAVNSEETTDTFIAYPSTPAEKNVVCIDGSECILTCIYGGRDWALDKDPPDPVWTLPAEAIDEMDQPSPGTTAKFVAFLGAQGVWTCGGGGEWPSAKINVTIKMYPNILEHEMIDQFVHNGTDVEFYCDAQYSEKIKFYINGQHVVEGKPPHVEYRAGSKMMRIANAQREHSSSVTCVAFNSFGVGYKAAELNVYTKPNLTLLPEGGMYLSNKTNQTSLDNIFFECSTNLDEKVLDADIYWKSNHSDVYGEKLKRRHPVGVRVKTDVYADQYISSKLYFQLDTDSIDTLSGAVWWCVVEMKFAGKEELVEFGSEAAPFVVAQVTAVTEQVKEEFEEWWLIGVIVAVCFFALIIVLIICCVRHNIGEEYYVDEKEKRAGHRPDEEMKLYGFSDYKRPNQDPVKGSRTSLDRSDKPLDSDSEGMDEYGDIDPGRFNEDGSFIGQYGKASSPMEV